jgi:hypothetical protein
MHIHIQVGVFQKFFGSFSEKKEEQMIVYGTLKGGECGGILFRGDVQECREYALQLDKTEWHRLSICEDNGKIVEYVVIPPCPTW